MKNNEVAPGALNLNEVSSSIAKQFKEALVRDRRANAFRLDVTHAIVEEVRRDVGFHCTTNVDFDSISVGDDGAFCGHLTVSVADNTYSFYYNGTSVEDLQLIVSK